MQITIPQSLLNNNNMLRNNLSQSLNINVPAGDPVRVATLPYLFFILSPQLFQLCFLLQQLLKFLLCLLGTDNTLWTG
jgi:hypothetical protein